MIKICFKCNKAKEIELFYKHPKTKDGFVNSCIECSLKLNTDNYYRKKLLQEGFAEKERLRSKEKYYKLNYKEKLIERSILLNLSLVAESHTNCPRRRT